MASIRPAKCYRWDSPAFTRVARNPQDSYISGIPASKLVKFDMGNMKGEFDSQISIIIEENMQIRNNALEAARITTNSTLEKTLGSANYFLKIRVFPHHVMRQNTQALGAGADRVSDGMRNSYGKPIGRAARVSKNKKIMTVYFNKTENRIRMVKNALRKGQMKLPGNTRLKFEEEGK